MNTMKVQSDAEDFQKTLLRAVQKVKNERYYSTYAKVSATA